MVQAFSSEDFSNKMLEKLKNKKSTKRPDCVFIFFWWNAHMWLKGCDKKTFLQTPVRHFRIKWIERAGMEKKKKKRSRVGKLQRRKQLRHGERKIKHRPTLIWSKQCISLMLWMEQTAVCIILLLYAQRNQTVT